MERNVIDRNRNQENNKMKHSVYSSIITLCLNAEVMASETTSHPAVFETVISLPTEIYFSYKA